MKASRFAVMCVVTVSFVLFIAGAGLAQDSKTVTIAEILKNAKCPLTDDQAKTVKEFKLGGGFESFRVLGELFNEKQDAALKEVLGVQQGRDGGPERPRFLFFVVIFENEGCPFTEAQIKEIKALPEGREGFEKMRDIFTEEQGGIMQEMFNR